jgi:predicted transposase YdaD
VVKIWDDSMRKLVRINPQSFLDLILPGAYYTRFLPEKLKNWQLEVDALLEAQFNDQDVLIHIEFQTYHDSSMGERLLRYNVLARGEYKKPVFSCVIHLLDDKLEQMSPLRWSLPGFPDDQEILRFHYGVIEISTLSYDDLLSTNRPALWAFMPLTRDGANQLCVEQMFKALQTVPDGEDIRVIGATIAALIFKRKNMPEDLKWLRRRFQQMHDIMRESPMFDWIKAEGIEEGIRVGREEGIQIGIEKGRAVALEGLRDALILAVQMRFPDLEPVARGYAQNIQDQALLSDIAKRVWNASDLTQAEKLLQE